MFLEGSGGGVIGSFVGCLMERETAADAALERVLGADLPEVGAALAEDCELARLGMVQEAQSGF
jgi:hypothetical protein